MEVTQIGTGQPSRLFVINHGRFNSTIEVFELPSPERLKEEIASSSIRAIYITTLTSPTFVAPNALAVISPTSFYLTNDHRFSRRLPWPIGAIIPIMESVLQLPLGWVDRIDLTEDLRSLTVTRVASGIPFANGIAISPNGKHVAVASSSKIAIYYYERDPETNTLEFKTSVPTPACPDNLSYGDDGVLFGAGHPSFLALILVAKGNVHALSPSWAWAVIPQELQSSQGAFDKADSEAPISAYSMAPIVETHTMKSVYQSDGSVYSSSSTIVVDQKAKKFFLVGLYADGILQCTCFTFLALIKG
ncbi:hypothetical protein FRC02_009648 [Tulasnella sp. 418]|nr:hypothetical protein FRC02_009648 [Tulasnella sp. 418]